MMDMEEVELLSMILKADTREDLDKAKEAIATWREKNGIPKVLVN